MIIIGVHITKHLSLEIVPSQNCGGMALGTPPAENSTLELPATPDRSRDPNPEIWIRVRSVVQPPPYLKVEQGMDGGQISSDRRGQQRKLE